MAYSHGTYTEFLRQVYRNGGPDCASRTAYLDGLASNALKASTTGKTLVSVSTGGSSHSYSAFAGYDPNQLLDLIAWARKYICVGTDDIDEVMLEVPARIRQFKTSTYCDPRFA